MPVNNYLEQMQWIAKNTRTTKIIRYFPNTDLRCNHTGLREHAKEHGDGLDIFELEPGEFVVFANKSVNRLKIATPGYGVYYLKSPTNQRIDLDVIRYLPRFFNGVEFNFKGAMKKVVETKLKKTA